MTDIDEVRTSLDKAKRDERSASSEMRRRDAQAEEQKKQLETLFNHRDECVEGLKKAKESWLTIVQMREYQLLLQHLSTVVEEQQTKVDISQNNYEQARSVWKLKHERCEKLEKLYEQLLAEQREQEEKEFEEKQTAGTTGNYLKEGGASGITGKRLKTG